MKQRLADRRASDPFGPQRRSEGQGSTARSGLGSVPVMTTSTEGMSPQQRAVATQEWEPAECDQPCPCGTPDCGHGEPCEAEDCEGHDRHTMRNPTTGDDVTAWQDSLDCCESCGSSFLNRSLPEQPWGTVSPDGTVTVFGGVSHYELGV